MNTYTVTPLAVTRGSVFLFLVFFSLPFPVFVCAHGRSLPGTDNHSHLWQISIQQPIKTLLTTQTLPNCYISHMVNCVAAQSLSVDIFLPIFVDTYLPFFPVIFSSRSRLQRFSIQLLALPCSRLKTCSPYPSFTHTFPDIKYSPLNVRLTYQF